MYQNPSNIQDESDGYFDADAKIPINGSNTYRSFIDNITFDFCIQYSYNINCQEKAKIKT